MTPPIPTPASAKPSLLDKIRNEVVIVGGVVIAVGEAVAPVLPEPYQSVVQVALPILVAGVARAKTFSLATVEQLLAKLRAAAAKH